MTKEAEEFYTVWAEELKETMTERGFVGIHMRDDFHILFAEAYAKHYAIELLRAETDEKLGQEAFIADHNENFIDGMQWLRDKLIKQIEG